ncbi:MAG: NAD(P)/FAD-dependent oxidoreductase [Kineosporiaceae bacterium]
MSSAPVPQPEAGPVWDIAVVGAGPAGSAAALAALQRWPQARVLLLDRAAFPRDKTCGDGVAAQVVDILDRLGVGDLLDDWPRVNRLRLGFPEGIGVARRLRRPTIVIPRAVFDARLVDAAVRRGAVLRQHRVRRLTRATTGSGDPVLELDGQLRARVVIGADGAHSAVRTGLGLPGPRPDRTAIALRGYAPVSAGREREQVIAFAGHTAWPAYAWSFPIGDGRANVGYGEALPARGPGPGRARMLDRLAALLPGAEIGGADWKAHHLPLSTGRVRQPDGPVLLAGDALGLINPLTGEGIHAAVRSGAIAGLAAAQQVHRGSPDRAAAVYRAGLHAALGRHLRHMAAVARMTGDVRVVSAGLQVAAEDQRIFDDFVDLGLADGALTGRMVLALARRGGVAGVAETLRGTVGGRTPARNG